MNSPRSFANVFLLLFPCTYSPIKIANDSDVIRAEVICTQLLDVLKKVPSLPEATKLAAKLVGEVSASGDSTFAAFLARRGWDLVFRPLGDEGSTIRSLLVPRGNAQFRAVITSRHPYDQDGIDWLLAHEYAHSLFFVDEAKSRRLVPWVEAEEVFCDAFADHFARAQGRPVLADAS
jgi:hypothetical protein